MLKLLSLTNEWRSYQSKFIVKAERQRLRPVILATQEAESRRIAVQSQLQPTVLKTLS
jgi:hypothetical protein